MNPLRESLDNVISSITPQNIIEAKEQLMNQIKQYQNIINQEEEKIKKNQLSKYDKNQINDASNMLEYFRNKLYLTFELNELNNLNAEFESEKIKYF